MPKQISGWDLPSKGAWSPSYLSNYVLSWLVTHAVQAVGAVLDNPPTSFSLRLEKRLRQIDFAHSNDLVRRHAPNVAAELIQMTCS